MLYNSATGTEFQATAPGPSARAYLPIAYDAARNRTVLFGGGNGGTDYGDTWEWNGTSWSQLQIAGPSPRRGHVMVYDATRHVTVLFGGVHAGTYNAETWELTPGCYPNCDASTVAPILNVNDFQCFINRFAAGDSYANCDGSTVAPVLNVNNFQCFLNTYAAGCS